MLTGVIFGAIVIAWIAYLVPYFLARRDQGGVIDEAAIDQFAESMKLVRRSGETPTSFLTDSGAQVSTPLTRSAAHHNLRQLARTSVKRRRRGLVLHVVLLAAGVAVPFFLPISHLWTLVPAGMFVGWMIVSRISVVTVRRLLDAERAELRFGDDEPTIVIAEDTGEDTMGIFAETERSIEITGPIQDTLGSLWDPIPVTPTTYVSRPLLPRSVRTIDLSAPVSSSELATPVTAERPAMLVDPADEQVTEVLDRDDLPRAVGE